MTIADQLKQAKADLDNVYQAGWLAGDFEGYSRGHGEGYTAGYEEGKNAGGGGGDSYYDTFWDEVQVGGTRTDYNYGFCHSTWTDTIFKPKYPMKPSNVYYMFTQSAITTLKDIDIDFSNVSSSGLVRPFDGSAIKYIGVIDISHLASPNINTLFAGASKLETVELFKVSDAGTVTFSTNTFQNCSALANINFGGLLNSDINMSACPLTTASLQSIIDHMATAATQRTLTLSATAKANLTAEQNAAVTAKNWKIA